MDRQTDRQTHTVRQTNRQTDRHKHTQEDRQTDTYRKTDRQTHTHTQTDRRTERQTKRQTHTDRRRHGQTDTHGPIIAASSRLTAMAPFGSNVYNKKKRSASASNSTDVILPEMLKINMLLN